MWTKAPRLAISAAVLAAAMFSTAARSEVYFSDLTVEISGTGSRTSRTCAIVLKPTLAFGEPMAPKLLITAAPSRLSWGVEKPGQYSSVAIVQGNTRRPFAGADNGSIDQFSTSEIGKAIKSGRLFFLTAQRTGTRSFVSSRYERIDLDAILARVETACPFDAESMMTSLSARESAERALSISQSDLTLIRWALNKKYGRAAGRPDPTSSLSSSERTYLKRYASDNGRPQSRYLTAELVLILKAEGQLIASAEPPTIQSPPPTPPPAPPSRSRNFERYDSVDFDGRDIPPWIRNSSVMACESACGDHASCRAFTFNRRYKVCILKSGVGELKPDRDAVSGSLTPVLITPR